MVASGTQGDLTIDDSGDDAGSVQVQHVGRGGGGIEPCVRMCNQADYWPLSDLGYAITHPPYDTPLFFCRCS